MASRNLTKNFKDIRSSSKASRPVVDNDVGDDGGLLQSDANASNFKSMKDTLPPLWVEKIEQAEEDISKIQNKMRDLSALHTKRLMVNFESDEAEQERRIETTTAAITQIFRHAEQILKKFGSSNNSAISKSELAVRTNLQRNLAKKLQGLSVAFRTSQKEYMEKLSAQTKGTTLDIFENKKSSAAVIDNGFNQSQLAVVDDNERLVNERDEEITKIAKNIEELAAIFKELSAMVIDQGTVLDRIDYNMEQTVDHTKEGIDQLTKAEEHQKANLAVKCIILLAVLIFIMVLILIFKHQKK